MKFVNYTGMKNYVLMAVCCALFLASCGIDGLKNSISGNIKDAGGKTIYLERYVSNRAVKTDSAVVAADGSFMIVANEPLALDYYNLVIDQEHYLTLITDSTEAPVVQANFSDMKFGSSVSGSESSAKLVEVTARIKEFNDRMKAIMDKMRNAGEAQTAQIQADRTALVKERTEFLKNWIESNSKSPAAIAVLKQLDIRTELALFKKVQGDLKNSFAHSIHYKDISMRIDNQEMTNAQPKDPLATEPQQRSQMNQELQKQIDQMKKQQMQQQQAQLPPTSKINVGMKAPEIADKSPDGKTYRLSQLKGKVVLLDFWASWCGPCRKENPLVLAAYNKYHKDGFEVFSVSLDNNADRWKQAIEQDGLTWPYHVSDLKQWRSVHSAAYGVSSIPSPFLIGRDGSVIALADKLRGPGLEAELHKIFGY